MTNDDVLNRVGWPRGRFWLVWLAVAFVLVLGCLPLDSAVNEAFASLRARPGVKSWDSRDWYQTLRQLGFLPVWLVTGLCLWLIDLGRGQALTPSWSRGALVAGGATLAGMLAEVLKPLVGRIKPEESLGDPLRFWPLGERVAKMSDTGFVSSHAAVSMGAAAALAYLFPRCGPVVVLAAMGTGLTRLLVGGHYLSDVVGGMLVGWLAARIVAAWTGVRRFGT
ncbi:MAG: phosphatase PAP2 family protein [Phycisphaerales bacterium]